MARFYGKIGFMQTVKESDGVYVESTIERYYYGDILSSRRKYETSGTLNDNINIPNRLSILSDSFLADNAYAIRYVEFMGTKWKINSIEIDYPRLILNFGGVYNG